MSGKSRSLVLIITLLVVLAACGIIIYISSNDAPSGTSASNNTPAVNPSAVASNDGNPTGEAAGAVLEPTPTADPGASQEPTGAPTIVISSTPTPEAMPDTTPKATPTSADSSGPTQSETPEVSSTPATPTSTPAPKPSPTPTVTPTQTPAATPIVTPKPTPTATPVATPSATPEATMTPEEFREKCKNDISRAGETLRRWEYMKRIKKLAATIPHFVFLHTFAYPSENGSTSSYPGGTISLPVASIYPHLPFLSTAASPSEKSSACSYTHGSIEEGLNTLRQVLDITE